MGDPEQAAAESTDAAGDRDFRPGDHVWMRCEAVGGIGYQHHGIVVKVLDDKRRMYVADFSAPNQSTIALPTSMTSSHSSRRGGKVPDWHGVRISAYDASEWRRVRYPDGEIPDDDDGIVLERVTFLLRNPHLLPRYEVLESNCETVAAWCKTGSFRTRQIAGLMEGGIRNGFVATGILAAAAAVLGPLPAVVGAGVVASMKWKEEGNEKKWRERTEVLNGEFERWREAWGSGCCIQ